MPLSATSRNAAVAAFAASAAYLSLHSSVPGDAGASEISGGSPAYARQPAVWNFPGAGIVALTTPVDFDVAAGSECAFVGAWSTLTGGLFLGWAPINGGTVHGVGFNRHSPKDIFAVAHGLAVGDRVAVTALPGLALPIGLNDLALYYVVSSPTADTFQIALTPFSVPIITGSTDDILWQRVAVDAFAAQGVEPVSTLTFTVGA